MKEEKHAHYIVYTCKGGPDRYYGLTGYTYTINKTESVIVRQYTILEKQKLKETLAKRNKTNDPEDIHLIKIITHEQHTELHKPKTYTPKTHTKTP